MIGLVRVLAVPYINTCDGNFGVYYNCIWIISYGNLIYVVTCKLLVNSSVILHQVSTSDILMPSSYKLL